MEEKGGKEEKVGRQGMAYYGQDKRCFDLGSASETPNFATLTPIFATLTPCGKPNQIAKEFLKQMWKLVCRFYTVIML